MTKPLTSELGWSTVDSITVYGQDLPGEILGHVDVGGMAFLGLMGRLPTAGESRVFNSLIVSLVEHGQTPSTIAARLTYLGAPESLQGAVASGLLGLGSVFVGSMEGAASLVQTALSSAEPGKPIAEVAKETVAELLASKQPLSGFGHPKHKPVDPRAVRLFAIAKEEDLYGRHCQLMEAMSVEINAQSNKVLPINATGAVGAIASDLGIPTVVIRGLGVIARSIGIVVHLLEETKNPIAKEIWNRIDDEVTDAQINPSRSSA
jgi:citrate synthase